jgi:hypothetical protein
VQGGDAGRRAEQGRQDVQRAAGRPGGGGQRTHQTEDRDPDGAEAAVPQADETDEHRVQGDDRERPDDEGDLVVLAEGLDGEGLDRLRGERDDGVADRDDR